MLGPVLWAIGAGLVTHYFVGAKGWLFIGPLIILLLINPAWGAAFFLVVGGILLAGLVLYLLILVFPYLFFFGLGIVMVYLLVIGLGQLMGVK